MPEYKDSKTFAEFLRDFGSRMVAVFSVVAVPLLFFLEATDDWGVIVRLFTLLVVLASVTIISIAWVDRAKIQSGKTDGVTP